MWVKGRMCPWGRGIGRGERELRGECRAEVPPANRASALTLSRFCDSRLRLDGWSLLYTPAAMRCLIAVRTSGTSHVKKVRNRC